MPSRLSVDARRGVVEQRREQRYSLTSGSRQQAPEPEAVTVHDQHCGCDRTLMPRGTWQPPARETWRSYRARLLRTVLSFTRRGCHGLDGVASPGSSAGLLGRVAVVTWERLLAAGDVLDDEGVGIEVYPVRLATLK